MYTGDEKLMINGKNLPYSILEFWQWSSSSLELNISRGTFAEYIVKCAMKSGGFDPSVPEKTGIEPFDLTGPEIHSLGRNSRIEVKSASFLQLWSDKPSTKANFRIPQAIVQTSSGDYPHASPRQRNNDLYVFCLYTADSHDCNILDLKWWRFFVYPTYKINEDDHLSKQKTISLVKIRKLGLCEYTFDNLYQAITDTIEDISHHYSKESCL